MAWAGTDGNSFESPHPVLGDRGKSEPEFSTHSISRTGAGAGYLYPRRLKIFRHVIVFVREIPRWVVQGALLPVYPRKQNTLNKMKMTQMNDLSFQLNLEGRPADAPPLFAYLVNTNGDTVETQSLGEKGILKFKTKTESLHSARILIAPAMPDKDQTPTLDQLREFNAYEPVVQFNAKDKIQQFASIPADLWSKWHLCLCRIRGRVEKDFCYWIKDPFCLNLPFLPPCPPKSYCFTLPVCPARVHICQVKPLIIWTLPDADVLRIRADLLNPLLVVPPFPPDPIGPIAELANAREEMPMSLNTAAPVAPQATAATGNSSAKFLSTALRFKLQSPSPDLLRLALSDHLKELIPFIPYFDWCRFFYTCQEIRVVDVDDHGRFDTWLLHDCKEKTNLYFWVEYLYNTNWVTIYQPSLCTGTFWNYACGTEAVLTTTDGRVSGCRPITGRFLEITRIGTGAWLPLIDAATGVVTGLDFGDSTIDPTGSSINSGTYARPFGAALVLSGNFGFNLPDPALATHYRVSFKLSSLPDGIDDTNWTLINTPLSRAYNDTLDIGGGLSKLVTSAFELKDPLFPDFYRIPKEDADQQTEIPKGADLQDRRWATDEFAIAVLDTEGLNLAEGSYDFRLQLCRPPTAGAAPVPVVVAREVFQMPDPANFNQSTFCDDDHLIQTPPGGPNANAFRMRLKVDRDHCVSLIADALMDGTGADPQCGILHRGTTATLAFTASQPQDRATFSFEVVRGNGNDVSANTGGFVSAAAANNGYTRTGTEFSALIPVSQLFAGCNCPSAAFAETLNVAAMATDGSNRLSAYDAPQRSAAFAIISP